MTPLKTENNRYFPFFWVIDAAQSRYNSIYTATRDVFIFYIAIDLFQCCMELFRAILNPYRLLEHLRAIIDLYDHYGGAVARITFREIIGFCNAFTK